MQWRILLRLIFLSIYIRAVFSVNAEQCAFFKIINDNCDPPNGVVVDENPMCSGTPAVQKQSIGETMILSMCPTNIVNPTFYRKNSSSTSDAMITNGDRYQIDGRTLTLTDVQPEDEGIYYCANVNDMSMNETLVCLAVVGLVEFNCNNGGRAMPQCSMECVDNISLFEGQDITFDTIRYGERGSCNCTQAIFGNPVFEKSTMDNWETIPGPDYRISNVSLNDTASYRLTVNVVALTSGILPYCKFFNVTVLPNPATAMPIVTTNSTTTPPATRTTGSPSTMPDLVLIFSVLGVVVVVSATLIVSVILIACVCLYCKHCVNIKKPPEGIYSEISETGKSFNDYGNVPADVTLSATLESSSVQL